MMRWIGPWLLALAAGASPEAAPVARFPDSLVVVAERGPEPLADTPAAVTVLDRAAIAPLPAENLAEVLDFVPGLVMLFPQSVGGVPMLLSRGFFGAGEAEYVQLRIDGVAVADAESGIADWRRVRAAGIERIEALHGAASALYGDTALGGVIDLTSRRPAPGARDWEGSAGLSAGSFGSAAVDLGFGSAAVQLTAGADRTDGFRELSASEEGSADLKLEGALSESGRWHLDLAGSTRDRREPGPLTAAALAADPSGADPTFRFDREETGRLRAAFRLEGTGERPWRLALQASRRETDSLRTLLLTPDFGDRSLRALATTAFGGSLESEGRTSLAGREAHFRIGLEAGREDLDTGYRPVDERGAAGGTAAALDARRERYAAFFTQSWRPSARWRLAAGLRWDTLRDVSSATSRETQEALSPRLGVTVDLGRQTVGFLQLSRAFKAATLDQLFDPRPFPDFAGGTFVVSNPQLAPQRARSAEAGVRRLAGRSELQLAAYRTTVEDEIDFDPATFRYANLAGSLHEGIEASLRLTGFRGIRPQLAYTLTRAELQSGPNRGRQLKNIPRHVLRAGAGFDLPWRLAAEVRGSWISRRFLDDGNLFPLADAVVWDLRLARPFGRHRVRLDLLNLADERYPALGYALPDATGAAVPLYFPAPGFAARAGVELGF